LEKWISDISQIGEVCITVACIAFFVASLFLFVLRRCAGIVTWSMIVGLFLSCLLGGGYLVYNANE